MLMNFFYSKKRWVAGIFGIFTPLLFVPIFVHSSLTVFLLGLTLYAMPTIALILISLFDSRKSFYKNKCSECDEEATGGKIIKYAFGTHGIICNRDHRSWLAKKLAQRKK